MTSATPHITGLKLAHTSLKKSRKSTSLTAIAIALLSLCLMQTNAWANKTEQELELEATQARLTQIAQELNFLQQKAYNSSPTLQKQKAEYDQVIKDEIKKAGVNSDELEARLRFLSHQLGNKALKLSKDEFKQVEKEFLDKRKLLNESFLKAAKSDAVKQAAKRYGDQVKQAMQAVSKDSASLQKELKELNARYKKLKGES